MRIYYIIFIAMLLSCSASMSGRLALDSGDPVVTTDGKVNITSLNSSKPHSLILNIDSDGKWSTDEDMESDEVLIEALVPGYGLFSKRIKTNEVKDIVLILKKTNPVSSEPISVNLNGDVTRGAGGATLTPPKL